MNAYSERFFFFPPGGVEFEFEFDRRQVKIEFELLWGDFEREFELCHRQFELEFELWTASPDSEACFFSELSLPTTFLNLFC